MAISQERLTISSALYSPLITVRCDELNDKLDPIPGYSYRECLFIFFFSPVIMKDDLIIYICYGFWVSDDILTEITYNLLYTCSFLSF